RPPGPLRDGRRPAVGTQRSAPVGAVPARRCRGAARRSGTRLRADDAAAGDAGHRRAGGAVSAPVGELLSLNTATVRQQWTLRQMTEACARPDIRGISPRRDKLDELGAAQAARLIRQHGLTVTGLCRGGMFPAADAAGRRAALEDNRHAVDDAATLGAQCLVLVVGGIVPGTKDLPGARQMVLDGISELLEYARGKVPLAIEPLHPMYCADRACVNTIDQALDIC